MDSSPENLPAKRSIRWLMSRLTAVLLLSSVALNVILARNLKELRSSIVYLKDELRAAKGLNVGESLPPLRARDLNGAALTIDYSENESPAVFYIFTPDCVWCTRNLPNANALAEAVRSKYRFIGLSLSREKLREYVTSHQVKFAVCTELPGRERSIYSFGGTPRTLVVSPDGRVLKNWFGAYGGDLLKEINQHFGIKLPGLDEVSNPASLKEDCQNCGEQSSRDSHQRNRSGSRE